MSSLDTTRAHQSRLIVWERAQLRVAFTPSNIRHHRGLQRRGDLCGEYLGSRENESYKSPFCRGITDM